MNVSFFVQPQVDHSHRAVFGYELLLRKEMNGHWAVPKSFTELSLDKQAELLEQLASQLQTKATNQVLALNLNRQQAEDDLMLGTIIYLKKVESGRADDWVDRMSFIKRDSKI